MKEEPINPGFANKIFELSHPSTIFNRSEFVDGNYDDKGLEFEYAVDVYPEYARLTLTIKYVQIGKESDYKLEKITFPISFKIIRATEILPYDLLVIFQYCIDMLNKEISQEPPLVGIPTEIPAPLWENYRESLENIAKDLNGN